MGHIDMKNNLDSKLQIRSICSVRIQSRSRDISNNHTSVPFSTLKPPPLEHRQHPIPVVYTFPPMVMIFVALRLFPIFRTLRFLMIFSVGKNFAFSKREKFFL